MATLTPSPKMQFFDANGNPLSGGKLYTYAAGTTTPLATYTNSGAGTPNANPIILDSRGEASVWLGTSLYYMELKTSSDALVWTSDNVGGVATLSALAASTGSSLVGFIQSGTGAVARTSLNKMREYISVVDFGAAGNGVTDDTASIAAALTAAAGKVLYLVPGSNYKITSALTVPASTVIYGYGAQITSTVAGSASINLSDSSIVLGLKLTGPTAASYVANESGIALSGSSSASYLTKCKIEDCEILQFGAYGIYSTFASDILIVNNNIHNCGYVGIAGHSPLNWRVTGNEVSTITPGTGGGAYGITLSRIAITDSEVTYPRPKNCLVSNNVIDAVTTWEGLDTHCGDGIAFIGNIVRNCKIGIHVGAANSISNPGQEVLAPKNIVISGNKIDCLGVSGGAGIYAIGAKGTGVGTPAEYANSISITGNEIYGGGTSANASGVDGGISVRSIKNLVIAGNSIRDSLCNGIFLYYDVIGMTISGNAVIDPHDSIDTIPCGIRLESGNITGVISGNSFIRDNAALDTYVAVRGISQTVSTGNSITLGDNYNTFTTPLVGVSDWVSYTPTITPGTGAFTTVSATGKYKKQNKTVFFEIHITITTNGTAATSIIATLPSATSVARAFAGASPSTGKSLACYSAPGASSVSIYSYDATYPGVSGYQYYVTGTYDE